MNAMQNEANSSLQKSKFELRRKMLIYIHKNFTTIIIFYYVKLLRNVLC